jgi:hypothetical protein
MMTADMKVLMNIAMLNVTAQWLYKTLSLEVSGKSWY